jgi:hypothetical protein
MLTRLRKLLLQSRVCAGCERYEITKGLLCVYCQLEAKLQPRPAGDRNTPGPGTTKPPLSDIPSCVADPRVQSLQDVTLLPPYIN